MDEKQVPSGYASPLSVKETFAAVFSIKSFFEVCLWLCCQGSGWCTVVNKNVISFSGYSHSVAPLCVVVVFSEQYLIHSQETFAKEFNLTRVIPPLFVESGTGVNDQLDDVKQPVDFQLKNEGKKLACEIIQVVTLVHSSFIIIIIILTLFIHHSSI